MPLPIPNLDNRRFADLVTSLRDQIPGRTTEWTDYNLSDPGMTVLELLCWVGDMVLYRINQIPERTRLNFFKLLLAPPEAVTVEVEMEYLPPLTPGAISIPPGIRFIAPAVSPPDLIFETFQSTPLIAASLDSPPFLSPPFGSPPEPGKVRFQVRSQVVVENEFLGISNGEPDQIFYLREGPVLIDPDNLGTGPGAYNPNPRISVDGVQWQFVVDFLEASTGAASTEFIVEALTRGVRFGDGVKGAIPPAGARISADRYQILQDKQVRVGRDSLVRLDAIPGFPDSNILSTRNSRAEGGLYIYPTEEMESTGLTLYSERFRAIAEEDFRDLATRQFNRSQESIPAPPQPSDLVSRAEVVAGKRPAASGTGYEDMQGAVTVIILPQPSSSTETLLQPSPDLIWRVKRFLDRRRLITTRLFVRGPEYVTTDIDIRVTAQPGASSQRLKAAIDSRIREFHHPLEGGDQGSGWPLGRSIYRSELFQLVESVEGVDHVRQIVIGGTPSLSEKPLSEGQLPALEDINVEF